jgi:carboxyl-terminal processing protease
MTRATRLRLRMPIGCLAAATCGAVAGCATPAPHAEEPRASVVATAVDSEEVFLEAWTLVRDNFYDPAFNGVNWEGVRDELLPAARASKDTAELSGVINASLARLRASHTRHYTPLEREYFELLDIFNPAPQGVPADLSPAIPAGPVTYVGIGLVAERIGGRLHVADAYDGAPAHRAGLRTGDELLGVEDGPWSDVEAFHEREGVPTRVQVRREEVGPAETVLVTPAKIQPREVFLRAMDESARLITQDGPSVAYVRMRSYAHSDYQDRLVELLRTRLSTADALVLDLRGPWGGASPEYMSLFNPLTPNYQYKHRNGEWTAMMFTWRRPAALVVDSGTRSGKELIAHAFRAHKVGPIMGTRTAGAVLGGRPFVLSGGSILYLAVQDARVDGVRLEGLGVEPTVVVERHLPFSKGRDEQVDAAVRVVLQAVPKRTP